MEKLSNVVERQLRDLNRALDDDYQKLSDKYHELLLSHNRKKRALLLIRSLFVRDFFGHESRSFGCSFGPLTIDGIIKTIDAALISDGRVNERSMVKKKAKGGAK